MMKDRKRKAMGLAALAKLRRAKRRNKLPADSMELYKAVRKAGLSFDG